jgi:RimJ/RimL family protein N-acetyltransferase
MRRDTESEAVELETARLRIREIELSDQADLFEHWSNPTYLEHVPVEPYTPDAIAAVIRRTQFLRSKEPRTNFLLVACDKVSGRFVGDGSLKIRSATAGQAEIGYSIRHDRAASGLATELAMALMDFGFSRLGLHRIYARCRVENGASRRIMAKLGMAEEGILRQDVRARGEWWSSIQCSILATDWADLR